jgi:hypothetical protein
VQQRGCEEVADHSGNIVRMGLKFNDKLLVEPGWLSRWTMHTTATVCTVYDRAFRLIQKKRAIIEGVKKCSMFNYRLSFSEGVFGAASFYKTLREAPPSMAYEN